MADKRIVFKDEIDIKELRYLNLILKDIQSKKKDVDSAKDLVEEASEDSVKVAQEISKLKCIKVDTKARVKGLVCFLTYLRSCDDKLPFWNGDVIVGGNSETDKRERLQEVKDALEELGADDLLSKIKLQDG